MHAESCGCRPDGAARTRVMHIILQNCSLRLPPVQGRLLLSNWWILLLGAAFQYVHGAFTAVAYHMHEPRETLKDLGFMAIPVRATGWNGCRAMR